jgi:hypothetical protein
MVKITLCGKEIPLYAKSVPYLQKKVLVPAWDMIQGGGTGGLGLGLDVATAPEKGYALLVLLAPNVPRYVPLHTFLGYPSADAMEADDSQDFDAAFTLPEFWAAIDAAIEVSGLKKILGVTKFVDPQWRRAVITEFLQEAVDSVRASMSLENSPSTKDGSEASTSGTTTATTPTANTESPTPVLSL